MRFILSVPLVLAAGLGAVAAAGATIFEGQLADPVMLNIGLSCQWQAKCVAAQKSAMVKSLKFVAKYRPPEWRVHLCNKNAKRTRSRLDWIGFDHCIRNTALRPLPPSLPQRTYKRRLRKSA